jgi:SAM-dependent methyltransferase
MRTLIDQKIAEEQLPTKNEANIAGAAALLEMGARLGVLNDIENSKYIDSTTLAESCKLPEVAVKAYLLALTSAGILECSSNSKVQSTDYVFTKTESYNRYKTESGYILWALSACRPFIEQARDFLSAPSSIPQGHPRDGGLVALASAWMGCLDYYPPAINVILEHNPSRLVDLGSGSGGLLIDILNKLPEATGLGIDLNPTACAHARRDAEIAGVADRLTIQERSIQSLASDATCLKGADIINAGFVFHDLFPVDADIASQVFSACYRALAPNNGLMVLTELIPYVQNDRERMFSAVLSFFHQEFMKRKIPTESEWSEKLHDAGFEEVKFHKIPMPGTRLIVARCTAS